MASLGIGERLRTARQALGLSLEEVETATRIRLSYLDALEREAFTELPNPAYVKGFLRSYAAHLGIPAAELLQAYPRDASSGTAVAEPVVRHESPIDVVITPATPYSRTRRLLTIAGIVVGMGLLIVVYVFFSQVREFARTPPPASSRKAPAPGEQPAPAPANAPPQTTSAAPSVQPPVPPPAAQPPAAPPAAAPAPAKPAPAPSSPAAPATPAAPPQTSGAPPYPPAGPSETGPPPAGAVQVAVTANDRSWVRAVADGAVVFEGFIDAGGRQGWQAARQITVKVGNAGAVEVIVNGRSLGPMGKPGAVIERTFQAGEAPSP
jgi:cytoskeletal protein RodZ